MSFGKEANKFTLLGYAEWISANRHGGKVSKPRRAGGYSESDLGLDDAPRLGPQTQENGHDQFDQGGDQTDQGGPSGDPNVSAVIKVIRGPDHLLTRGPDQQVIIPKNNSSAEPSPEQVPPLGPPGGGNSENLDWKGRALAALREGCRNLDAIEHLIAPLLASDKRLSLGNDPFAAFREIATAAQGLDPAALAATVKRPREHPHKLNQQTMLKQIDIAKRAGAMLMVTRGSPQWKAWLDHFQNTEPPRAQSMPRFEKYQVASEWPPWG